VAGNTYNIVYNRGDEDMKLERFDALLIISLVVGIISLFLVVILQNLRYLFFTGVACGWLCWYVYLALQHSKKEGYKKI